MTTGLATTRLSSKGQVVIPEEVRNSLGLKPGVQFIVIGSGDAVILKAISEPSLDQFDGLLEDAQKKAKNARMKKTDIKKAIKKVRRKK